MSQLDRSTETPQALQYQERMRLNREIGGEHMIKLLPNFDICGVPIGVSPTCTCGWARLDMIEDEEVARDATYDHLRDIAELRKVS